MKNHHCIQELVDFLMDEKAIIDKSKTQYYISNERFHSSYLDLYCQLSDGRNVNVEIQTSQNDDLVKRTRYQIAQLDVNSLGKKKNYRDIDDVYIFWICAFDYFNEKKMIYHVDRMLRECNRIIDDGIHIVFLNAAHADESTMGKFLTYFLNSNGICPCIPIISNQVKIEKQKEGEKMAVTIDQMFYEKNEHLRIERDQIIKDYEELEKKKAEFEAKVQKSEQEKHNLDVMSLELNFREYNINKESESLKQMRNEINQKSDELNQKSDELDQKSDELNQKSDELNQKSDELNQKSDELNQKSDELNQKSEYMFINQVHLMKQYIELGFCKEEIRCKFEYLTDCEFESLLNHLK